MLGRLRFRPQSRTNSESAPAPIRLLLRSCLGFPFAADEQDAGFVVTENFQPRLGLPLVALAFGHNVIAASRVGAEAPDGDCHFTGSPRLLIFPYIPNGAGWQQLIQPPIRPEERPEFLDVRFHLITV